MSEQQINHVLFGIFVWSKENRYPKEKAVKVYKREKAADEFCRTQQAAINNYVVRRIWL